MPNDAAQFCQATTAIDDIYRAADDAPLDAADRAIVRSHVEALRPLIPDAYRDDFRLRYWPTTDVSGLDTSGIRAQEAYDRMQALFDRTCTVP